jgi:hypothetical protein
MQQLLQTSGLLQMLDIGDVSQELQVVDFVAKVAGVGPFVGEGEQISDVF